MFIEVWGIKKGEQGERWHALFLPHIVVVSDLGDYADIRMSDGAQIEADESYTKVMNKIQKQAKKSSWFGGVLFG